MVKYSASVKDRIQELREQFDELVQSQAETNNRIDNLEGETSRIDDVEYEMARVYHLEDEMSRIDDLERDLAELTERVKKLEPDHPVADGDVRIGADART